MLDVAEEVRAFDASDTLQEHHTAFFSNTAIDIVVCPVTCEHVSVDSCNVFQDT